MNARRRGSTRAPLIAALVVAAIAGCSAPTPEPTPGPHATTSGASQEGSASLPSIVPTAEAAYPRPLQADRIVEILVSAEGDGDAFVTGVQLETPYFEPGPVSPTVVRVREGWPGHARVPLTRAVCPAPAGTSVARVTVSATSRATGGSTTEAVLTVADAALAEINRVECLQRDALDAAQPSFGELLDTDATQAQATLVFTRGVSNKPVAINGVKGNVIFTLQARDVALPVSMDSSAQRVEIPITVRASRCDPHAFAESKKTFVFGVWIQVDGREQFVEFQPDPAWRATLQSLFDACGQVERS